MKYILILVAALGFIARPACAQSQELPGAGTAAVFSKLSPARQHAWYISWGYNGEWYTRSNVHVKQDDLGNDYILRSVVAHDHKGWNETSIFKQALTIPQYNYRIGYVLDEVRGVGIEINFDHTKYIIDDAGQDLRLTGKFNGQPADTMIHYARENGFYYYLNNGANFFLINLTKRWDLYRMPSDKFRLSAVGKVGIGPVVPHVENSFFGKANNPHFQIGGWNTGVEGDIKATFFRYVYLEYGIKGDYARYSNLGIYDGTARQAFGTFEMILSLGVYVPGRIRQASSH